MAESPSPEEGLPGFLARHPAAQYLLVAVLGVVGIFIAMPIDLSPSSRVEWVDLIINFIILVPSVMLTTAGCLLTIGSTVAPSLLDPDGPFSRFAQRVLRTIGVPRAVLPDFAILGPLGLLAQIFSAQEETGEFPAPDSDSDTDEPTT